jgi:predicted short-subunit dehydrogenase-like oxidoreductase (DUF2520 family)
MKICLIGIGNLGHHLAKKMVQKKLKLVQIYGRNPHLLQDLTNQLGIDGTANFKEIKTDCDLYILAVSDNAVIDVAKELAKLSIKKAALVVHTSGSNSIEILSPFFPNIGVLYPLQTFSKGINPDFQNIPIFINTHPNYQKKLEKIAQKLSSKVYLLDDKNRLSLHIAAVFANNFTNHLLQISQEILEKQGIPLSVLFPLLQQTIAKIEHQSPKDMQTGPAIRGDMDTIEKQETFLKENFNTYLDIYQTITKSIISNQGNQLLIDELK